jgi:hypothetical protein
MSIQFVNVLVLLIRICVVVRVPVHVYTNMFRSHRLVASSEITPQEHLHRNLEKRTVHANFALLMYKDVRWATRTGRAGARKYSACRGIGYLGSSTLRPISPEHDLWPDIRIRPAKFRRGDGAFFQTFLPDDGADAFNLETT